ncbi:MAG TPA: hypothetical protein VHB77_15960 [Planctomycetaceae bacterium]|jgi:hypothetical protein|nr:hypothetical protein [Planctomycetaceae bacterium]
MREEYVGYLIGAIDDSDRQAVEAHLQLNIEEHRHVERLRSALAVFQNVHAEVDVPHGLALRTCARVRAFISDPVS